MIKRYLLDIFHQDICEIFVPIMTKLEAVRSGRAVKGAVLMTDIEFSRGFESGDRFHNLQLAWDTDNIL